MIKEVVKRLAGLCGYRVMRNHPGFVVDWIPDLPQKINILELLIRQELARDDHFSFVQVGANDGRHADPIFELVHKYRLPGILIEPVPETYSRLTSSYASLADLLEFENVAITVAGERRGDLPFYVFSSANPERRYLLSGYSTTSRPKIEEVKRISGIPERIERISVKSESVAEFARRKGLKSISLLVTDVEGGDIELVSEFVSQGLAPRIIFMEILGQPRSKLATFTASLIECGYLVGGNVSDLIAYRE